MSWSIGWDSKWQRDIGYGVPAYCDSPDCGAEIDRGLSFVCGGEPYGGERGCGLYFCDKHLQVEVPEEEDIKMVPLCLKCSVEQAPYEPTPDHPDWIKHKMTDPSWAEWRKETLVLDHKEEK